MTILEFLQWLVSAEIMLLLWTGLLVLWMTSVIKSHFIRIVLFIIALLLICQIWVAGGGFAGLFNSVPGWILSPDINFFGR